MLSLCGGGRRRPKRAAGAGEGGADGANSKMQPLVQAAPAIGQGRVAADAALVAAVAEAAEPVQVQVQVKAPAPPAEGQAQGGEVGEAQAVRNSRAAPAGGSPRLERAAAVDEMELLHDDEAGLPMAEAVAAAADKAKGKPAAAAAAGAARGAGSPAAAHNRKAGKNEVHGDGGAAFYRQLEAEAAKRAASEELKPNLEASAPIAPVKVKTTKEGEAKITEHSQRVLQKRLLKELKDIEKCESLTKGVFTVKLANGNLFEWDVKLFKFDDESALARDLAMLKSAHGIDNVWLRFSFPENFPFAPPFVRVMAPYVQGGYVLSGGAICMELLTPDGWVQAYRMEAVILQTMATMIKGKARIVTNVRRQFSEEEARKSYDYLVRTHAKHGWREQPKEEG